jgi:hypothetical protein
MFLILCGLILVFSLVGAGLIGHFLRHSKKPPLLRNDN